MRGSCWLDTATYVLTRDLATKEYVVQSMEKRKKGPYKQLIDAFLLYGKAFEQNENGRKGYLLHDLHAAIRNVGSIDMDDRGYGDYLAFIYLLCNLADVSTAESPLPSAPYELVMSFGGLSDLKTDFVTMSIDVLHRGFDPHVVGFYATGRDSLELYDNQVYMYKDKIEGVDTESSYMSVKASDDMQKVFANLELEPLGMTLQLRHVNETDGARID